MIKPISEALKESGLGARPAPPDHRDYSRSDGLAVLEQDVRTFLKNHRDGFTDTMRIANAIYNLRYGVLMEIAKEIMPNDADKFAKDLYAWSELKMQAAFKPQQEEEAIA